MKLEDALRAQVAQLQEENLQLRALMGGNPDDWRLVKLAELGPLEPRGRQVLLALFDHAGRPLTALGYDLIFRDGEPSSARTLHVQMLRLRRLLGRDAIVTHWGRGFSLGAAMRARLVALFAEGVA